jgi:subtilisin family serine protease
VLKHLQPFSLAGVRSTHVEFVDPTTNLSRAKHGFDAVSSINTTEDCHGHGTHVAAVVGGESWSYSCKPHNVSYKAVSGHIPFASAVCHNQ